jgi:hypothetical protein
VPATMPGAAITSAWGLRFTFRLRYRPFRLQLAPRVRPRAPCGFRAARPSNACKPVLFCGDYHRKPPCPRTECIKV